MDAIKAWSWTKSGFTGHVQQSIRKNRFNRNIRYTPGDFPSLFKFIEEDFDYFFAADGETLAILADGEVRKVEIVSSKSGEPLLIKTLPDPMAEITALGLSADGKTMALGNRGGLVEIWNVGDEGPRQTIRDEAQAEIESVFFIDEKILISGTNVGTLKVWSLVEEKLVKTVKLTEEGDVWIKAVTPDGDLAVVAQNGFLSFVSLKEDKQVGKFAREGEVARAAILSSDGMRLAAGLDQNIYLLDMKNFSMLGCLSALDYIEEGTEVGFVKLSRVEKGQAPCENSLPDGAACLCDCVGANHTYETAVCSCDSVYVPKGHKVEGGVCNCDTLSTGKKKKSGISSPGGGGGHYWKPN